MTDRRVMLRFTSPKPLSYGPGYDDNLSHIILEINNSTGGYCNAYDNEGNIYEVVFGVPEIAVTLLERSPEEFENLSGLSYWVEELGLTGIEWEIGERDQI